MHRPNTTFDLYHSGGPPAAPAAAGLQGFLADHWQRGGLACKGDRTWFWTAILDVPLDTDLRDGYPASPMSSVWVPNQNGQKYSVIFVERMRSGRGSEFKRAYLLREGVTVAINVQEL